MDKTRTFGWIQDSQNIESLYNLICLFDSASAVHKRILSSDISTLVADAADRTRLTKALNARPLRIKYADLPGKRKQYKGLVQLVIPGQKAGKPLTDWAGDNFVRWAHALQFIAHDRASDTFELTPLGAQYIAQPNTGGINQIFEDTTLSYPPAIRVLRLLKDQGHLTKFEIGEQLGFVGESGFTHQPQDALLYQLKHLPKGKSRSKVLADYEGTSDKYARGIATWLIKLGWVEEKPKKVTATYKGIAYSDVIPKAYTITHNGEQALRRAEGYSSKPTMPKNVFWEMLSGGNEADQAFLRTRRGLLVECIQSKARTISQIVSELAAKNVDNIDAPTVGDDIEGLRRIGLTVKEQKGAFTLKDPIRYLNIPKAAPPQSTQIQKAKTFVRARLHHVPHEYLVLIDLGFDGSSDRIYEVQTMKLLNACGFLGGWRGGSDKPDGALWTSGESKDYGLIVDTKAYAKGFNCDAKKGRDSMQRYLQENIDKPTPHVNSWWSDFPGLLAPPDDFRFLFVSGALVGKFVEQIQRLNRNTRNTLGAGITSENLLLWAEEVMSGNISLADGYTRFGVLDMVPPP